MADEIEKVRREDGANVMGAVAREKIRYITMKLDENERSTQIRLMKVKDMMLEKFIITASVPAYSEGKVWRSAVSIRMVFTQKMEINMEEKENAAAKDIYAVYEYWKQCWQTKRRK